MANRRPERDAIEEILKTEQGRKAHDIAEQVGLIDDMGYDKAVDYVKRVRRSMRAKGEIPPNTARFGTDEGRLEDITKLFEIRQGRMSRKAAYHMLLLNCYLRFRSTDDAIHMDAIDDTYRRNEALENPFDMGQAIHICDVALARYMWSQDDKRNEDARKKGLPNAGLSYANESLIRNLEITEEELQHLTSIRKE